MVVEAHCPGPVGPSNRMQEVGQVKPGGFHPEALVKDALLLDKSGSMKDKGFKTGRSKKDLVREAVSLFLEHKREPRPTDMVSIISFDHAATVCCDPVNICTGYDALVQGLDQAMSPPHGGTDLSLALVAAQIMLERYGFLGPHSPFVCRVLVFSDGHSSHRGQAVGAAQALKNAGALVETLGLGRSPADVDESLLRECATTDEDGFTHYRFLGDAASLFLTFKETATGTLTWEE